jgi:hypothetical protein
VGRNAIAGLTLPNSVVARAYLLRGIGLWVGGRLLHALVLALAELPPLPVSKLTSLHVIFVTGLLALADIHRRKERAFLGNLGVSRATMAAICGLPAAIGEAIVAFVVRST